MGLILMVRGWVGDLLWRNLLVMVVGWLCKCTLDVGVSM